MVTSSATPIQHTRSRGGRDPETVELSARPDGTFGALSSNGATIYSVRPVGFGFSCACRGFAGAGDMLSHAGGGSGPYVRLV